MKAERLLDYIYPPRCPVCDGVSGEGICPSCRKFVVPIGEAHCLKCGQPIVGEQEEYCPACQKRRHYFDRGRSLFSYRGRLRQSVYRMKYANRREYGKTYGRELAVCLGGWVLRTGAERIVPIPLHPSRQRVRGYNQAALIARELGRILALPVDEDLLSRAKKTVPQKVLGGTQRRKNLEEAFRVRGEVREGERILLVDDIYTTGSTVDAAALCLKRRAPCAVFVLTVAIGG